MPEYATVEQLDAHIAQTTRSLETMMRIIATLNDMRGQMGVVQIGCLVALHAISEVSGTDAPIRRAILEAEALTASLREDLQFPPEWLAAMDEAVATLRSRHATLKREQNWR